MNLRTSHTSVGTPIALISYNLYDRGIIPLLFTHKPIYSVSFFPENDVSVFTFNSASTSHYRTLSSVFIIYSISCLVINSTSFM